MVTIRAERIEDADAIAGNHIAAWRVAYQGMIPDDVLDALDPAEWAQRRRAGFGAAARPAALVAVDDRDVPVGHVMTGSYRVDQDPERQESSIGEIWAIYCHPDQWGRGTGKALIEAGLAALPQSVVRLWVLADNLRARRFYERNGLHPDGTTALWTPRGSDVSLPEVRYAIVR
ncbi:ribosomal protein S18 acetylase RimI-like enzyme [Allocatelliglobosispora scoriae]|uniref:Ribosomal protein S18 acetylase RimI-like enzyme n=1 Tax=Allocatelliglobosispora scoriae TaxID=643052 RepID=A0A841C016_9ACTN|nr:GNAT family N-acetyltransferase [Allocatelliglobosispora scoriae]MBB5872300.1 ribosomal protein S18 acetylase RimI-like enzyme [Allocatelliglobosispora scoriae]